MHIHMMTPDPAVEYLTEVAVLREKFSKSYLGLDYGNRVLTSSKRFVFLFFQTSFPFFLVLTLSQLSIRVARVKFFCVFLVPVRDHKIFSYDIPSCHKSYICHA